MRGRDFRDLRASFRAGAAATVPPRRFYRAWRVKDRLTRQIPSDGLASVVGRCSECGEEVWVQPENAEGCTIVCWTCTNGSGE